METALIIGQILFYFTVSIAIIVSGVIFVLIAYRLAKIAKNLEAISKNLNEASEEVVERVQDVIDQLSGLPVLAYFLRKRHSSKRRNTKGPKEE